MQKISSDLIRCLVERKARGETVTSIHQLVVKGQAQTAVDGASEVNNFEPVQVSYSRVAALLSKPENKQAIHERRAELFNSIDDCPYAWPGFRISQMGKLVTHAMEMFESETKSEPRRRWAVEARNTLTDLDRMMARVGPQKSTEHKHLHLHGANGGTDSLVSTLSTRLSELAKSGLLEEAVEVIAPASKKTNAR